MGGGASTAVPVSGGLVPIVLLHVLLEFSHLLLRPVSMRVVEDRLLVPLQALVWRPACL